MSCHISKFLKIQNFLKTLQITKIQYKDIGWTQQIEVNYRLPTFEGSLHLTLSNHLTFIITLSQNYEFHISFNNESIIQTKSIGVENGYEVYVGLPDVIKYSQQIKNQVEQLNSKFQLIFKIATEVKKIIEE